MPGIVTASAPHLVMPESLSVTFEETRQIVARVNEMPDGSSIRKALHSAPRRKFTLTKRLLAVKHLLSDPDPPFVALRAFIESVHYGMDPFYFYNYREGAYDPFGVSESGRYTVVFRGSWSEPLSIGSLSECGLILEEVE